MLNLTSSKKDSICRVRETRWTCPANFGNVRRRAVVKFSQMSGKMLEMSGEAQNNSTYSGIPIACTPMDQAVYLTWFIQFIILYSLYKKKSNTYNMRDVSGIYKHLVVCVCFAFHFPAAWGAHFTAAMVMQFILIIELTSKAAKASCHNKFSTMIPGNVKANNFSWILNDHR